MKHLYIALTMSLALSFTAAVALARDPHPATEQANRGREIFFASQKGTACATCHEAEGLGTAVGPDLAKVAASLEPRQIASLMLARVAEHVQIIHASGKTFAGIQKQKRGREVEVWDLNQMPPVLRTLSANQIESTKPYPEWQHPPKQDGYTSQEIADVIGYLKWAAAGSQREIRPDEVDSPPGFRSR